MAQTLPSDRSDARELIASAGVVTCLAGAVWIQTAGLDLAPYLNAAAVLFLLWRGGRAH